MKYLKFVGLVLILSSCKYMIEKKYGFNTKFSFKTKDEYATHVKNQFGISDSLIFYPDTSSYSAFTTTFSQDVSIYYGAFTSDSTQIKKSSDLKTNESCKGRIGTELASLVKLKPEELELDSLIDLRKYSFHNINNENITFDLRNNKRYTILLIYLYGFGRYYDDLYKEIITAYNKNSQAYDLKFIVLDNHVSYLK